MKKNGEKEKTLLLWRLSTFPCADSRQPQIKTLKSGSNHLNTSSVISCSACHSTTLYDDAFEPLNDGVQPQQLVIGAPMESYGTGLGIKDGVTFPSGAEVTLNGPSNMCMTCHQGRASTVDVNEAIGNNNFGFINIHYFAAAATLFGT